MSGLRGHTLNGLSHPDHAVDLAAFLDEEALGRDIPMNDARRLELHPFLGSDPAAHFPADVARA